MINDRAAHWIKLNHQNRIPKRWVVFDTESKSSYDGIIETQTWRTGYAIRWREDLKTGDKAESENFGNARSLWEWVTDYCKPHTRTVVFAHNLGYDVRIADILAILPRLGWELEWCNLDRNVSSMTWRGERGTLVFADTWTWLPIPLTTVGKLTGQPKLSMPPCNASDKRWQQYCQRDTEILYRTVKDLIGYIKAEGLGNWQPTGAGMSYATWRHKFMTHKVLVHDDEDALKAERAAMHTGRAEAWKHGELGHTLWTEVDMRNAYLRIAQECELPVKLKFRTGAINASQYHALCGTYRVLCRVAIDTDTPLVPYHNGDRTIWPVGTFTTWLWDAEMRLLKRPGTTCKIKEAYVYTKAPILKEWADWALDILRPENEGISPVVRTWVKHCSRALIGRLALRTSTWEYYGQNPDGETGISYDVDHRTGEVTRMMTVGSKMFAESARAEGRDSLPQVTGWIMAECRARLWEALDAAGAEHVAHVDTDCVLVDRKGMRALQRATAGRWRTHWQVKASYRELIVYGPRNYRAPSRRVAAGVPRKAVEVAPNTFEGERWLALGSELEDGRTATVTVRSDRWTVACRDPRREDSPGVPGETVAIRVG